MATPGDARKLRVAVLIDSLLRPGGGERLAVENAIRLDPDRFERTLCVTRFAIAHRETEPARSLIARMEDAGVRVIGLERDSAVAVRPWLPLVRLLRGEDVDVLHGHMFGSNVWAVVMGRLCRVPVIVAHEHMWSYGGGRTRAFIDRELIARGADAFIAVTSTGRDLMIEEEGIDPSNIVTIPNGIASCPLPDRKASRERFGLIAGVPAVGTVGHLRPEKAFEVLIEAAALMRASHADVQVLIAGEGPERSGLEEEISKRGLAATVRLLGAREDIPELLAALDVAVCCSDFEGGPLSVMEYMRAGLPVVATRVGGLPELVRDGKTGILVPRREPGSLADAVSELLGDDERRGTLGRNGRTLQRAEYDIDVWVRRLESLYLELCDRPTVGSSRATPISVPRQKWSRGRSANS